MGINWQYVEYLDRQGVFARSGARVLDIGSSNLYLGTAGPIADFIMRHNPAFKGDLAALSARLEAGSAYDPVTGGINESFVGEAMEAAGLHYDAIDIADGYKTTIVDLNHHGLPPAFQKAYDVVMNFGTTEHIFNQLNSFKAIHEATKPDGYIFHQLPYIGFIDHCYFTYNGRFFFDMAGYNNYEIVDFWFDGPGGPENMFDSVTSYQGLFPALARLLAKIGTETRETALAEAKIPTVSINVLFRKTKDAPFIGAIEMSTSVGTVPDHVKADYSSSKT
jgi:SAM-dependent methyltransferase